MPRRNAKRHLHRHFISTRVSASVALEAKSEKKRENSCSSFMLPQGRLHRCPRSFFHRFQRALRTFKHTRRGIQDLQLLTYLRKYMALQRQILRFLSNEELYKIIEIKMFSLSVSSNLYQLIYGYFSPNTTQLLYLEQTKQFCQYAKSANLPKQFCL